MIKISQLKLSPAARQDELKQAIVKTLHLKEEEAFSFEVLRQSVDARRKPELLYVYTVCVTLRDESRERQILKKCKNRNVERGKLPAYSYSVSVPHHAKARPVIVGTGPAGLFCGLLLARQGLRPILIERGERARKRTQSVQSFWDTGILDPESNVQFGEGGAGTFSDGKLNTGIKDPDGRIRFVLKTFVDAGADPDILYSYKPHVGTDVLTEVVTRITDEIAERGGTVYFRTRLQKLTRNENGSWDLTCKQTIQEGNDIRETDLNLQASRVVLAIGHSSRDTFGMLRDSGLRMLPKAFAVGVRIQHPQSLIDCAMYGADCPYCMPPSPYKLTHRLGNGNGVYSFCMCPGGYVVNASSQSGMLAVNGMSYHDRASGNANSAIVVTVSPEEIASYLSENETYIPEQAAKPDVLIGMEFQRRLEAAAFNEGRGRIPLQRFEDYQNRRTGTYSFSFEPKVKGTWSRGNLWNVLPTQIGEGIEEGICAWNRQIGGFASPDAILAGIESRTSSPVRIERGQDCQAVMHPGIYPCGEGAGYAGGITSAAADGLRVAEAILHESDY